MFTSFLLVRAKHYAGFSPLFVLESNDFRITDKDYAGDYEVVDEGNTYSKLENGTELQNSRLFVGTKGTRALVNEDCAAQLI
jgi:hypothetical protein